MEKKLLLASAFLIIFNSDSMAGEEKSSLISKIRVFSKEDILRLTDAYVNNNLKIENPAIVDVDGDGDFDILSFKEGNVEYYENIGTLEKPEFILKNKNYDSYKTALMLQTGMPLPVFFADADGD